MSTIAQRVEVARRVRCNVVRDHTGATMLVATVVAIEACECGCQKIFMRTLDDQETAITFSALSTDMAMELAADLMKAVRKLRPEARAERGH